MRGVLAVLLIGVLSMLFAEVFSGASQVWYINPFSILIAFFLYLGHVVFFLHIAIKSNKLNFTQLYFLGAIFALYESWITKVLWSGYMDSTGPSLGTIFGLGTFEFPILVFFWHPIMSFIIPILVYQIISKTSLTVHKNLLKKTKSKTFLAIFFAVAVSTFIANGNSFNMISTFFSLFGTALIVLILAFIVKPKNIQDINLSKNGYIVSIVYLILLYTVSFFALLPQNLPTTISPYISILISYSVFIYLFRKTNPEKIKIKKLSKNEYSTKDLVNFLIIVLISALLSCLVPSFSLFILALTYLTLTIIGIIIFIYFTFKTLKTPPSS